MKFDFLSKIAPPNGVFRTGQILAGQSSPGDVRRQLGRWTRAGKVSQLRRGVYALAEPYARVPAHPFAAATSCRIPSYVSLQSALAHYGMIPEYVPTATCITTGRPEQLTTPLGRFIYKHVSPSRFFGFTETPLDRYQSCLLASPQKALVDLLYLTPESDGEAYLRELRIEPPDEFDHKLLEETATKMQSKKVSRAVKRLLAGWREGAI